MSASAAVLAPVKAAIMSAAWMARAKLNLFMLSDPRFFWSAAETACVFRTPERTETTGAKAPLRPGIEGVGREAAGRARQQAYRHARCARPGPHIAAARQRPWEDPPAPSAARTSR